MSEPHNPDHCMVCCNESACVQQYTTPYTGLACFSADSESMVLTSCGFWLTTGPTQDLSDAIRTRFWAVLKPTRAGL